MRLLHTSIAVRDMEESIAFYTGNIGLKVERRKEVPEINVEVAFLVDGVSEHRVELITWRGRQGSEAGEHVDHLAFQVDDLHVFVSEMKRRGVRILKKPFTLKGSEARYAFIADPNGVPIELIQRP